MNFELGREIRECVFPSNGTIKSNALRLEGEWQVYRKEMEDTCEKEIRMCRR